MNIKNLLKRIIDPSHYSSEAYIQYLRNSGVHIGEKTIVYAPRHTSIDIQKPHLISIGSYCKITTGVIILAHDYSISVARRVFGEFIGGTAPTKIGDNCFFGNEFNNSSRNDDWKQLYCGCGIRCRGEVP